MAARVDETDERFAWKGAFAGTSKAVPHVVPRLCGTTPHRAFDLSRRLVPDELWELAAPLVPRFTSRPQGGGAGPVEQRAVFAAMVYVLACGCAWRYLPPTFGVLSATAHRRFIASTEAGLWRRLHRAVLDGLGALGLAGVDVCGLRCRVGAGEKRRVR
ncbi:MULTISPECIES: transposase [unclassified Streptomyces]|uniref:transposase n=1 Tax=unclassified Streptomyces TaxID=2593676 RepID=UPI000B884360